MSFTKLEDRSTLFTTTGQFLVGNSDKQQSADGKKLCGTNDSLTDVDKIEVGDFENKSNLWDDKDLPFWGDNEMESGSSDFDVFCQAKRNSNRCLRCKIHVYTTARYCRSCYMKRQEWIPMEPTRKRRQKLKLHIHTPKSRSKQSKRNSSLRSDTRTDSDIERDILKLKRATAGLPLSQYTNLPSALKYFRARSEFSSTDSNTDVQTGI